MNKKRITSHWWNIFHSFPPESNKFRRIYILSFSITILLYFVSASIAFYIHKSLCKEIRIIARICNCEKQKNYWEELKNIENEEKKAAAIRSNQLKFIRTNPDDKNYIKSWKWFESELNELDKTIQTQKFRILPIGYDFVFSVSIVIITMTFYLLLCRLIILHIKTVQTSSKSFKKFKFSFDKWKLSFYLFGISFSLSMIISNLLTSVFVKDKNWFGYGSFCVTPPSFVIEQFALIPLGLVASAPFTILWVYSRKNNIPSLDIWAKDKKFGVERYVEFLQTWTMWLILAPSILGILFFRYVIEMETFFSPVRLLYGFPIALVIILLIIRLLRNAIILKLNCKKLLVNNRFNENDIIPEDPTLGFLGKEWWKFPATISLSLGTIWIILEFFGISKFIVALIQKTN